MSQIVDWGKHMRLETEEELQRANQLVEENPNRFEIAANAGNILWHLTDWTNDNAIREWIANNGNRPPTADDTGHLPTHG